MNANNNAETATETEVIDGRTIMSFANNDVAKAIFGPYEQHLAHIEKATGAALSSRGNQLVLSGDADAVAHARSTIDYLATLYAREGELTLADVDAALRMAPLEIADEAPISPVANANQMSLPSMERVSHAAIITTRKKTIQARTPNQNLYIKAMERHELVFGVGPAGTGKTYLAVAYAAQLLEKGVVERIVLSRPAVEAGERLGFLPGDLKEKVDPYLRPLYDALYDMMPGEKVERALTSGVIEIAPLAFMRGRTLSHAAVILDEAQNTTSMQMKMFLTRLGEGGRMIVTGDPSQIDLMPGQKSGLVEALSVLRDVDAIGRVDFEQKDVVRHPLVAKIVGAYEKAHGNPALPSKRRDPS